MVSLATIPQIRGLPVVGNLPEFRFRRLELYLRIARECGDIGTYRVGPRTIVLLNAPELAQEVLVEQSEAFEKPGILRVPARPVLGNGLLTSDNAFHRRQRRMVAPAFQHRRIAAYADVMAEYAEQIQQRWPSGSTIDVSREMMRLTLWIVGKTLFDANALAWSWYLLAKHPAIYARMRQEAQTVLAGRTPAYADLAQLPYTLRVLKEAMRLFPPAPAIGREAARDVVVGGHHIPAGTTVVISSYALHRRPDNFPNPDRFDLERWTPEQEARLPRHAYLPFGGGPRICIGNHFALMEGQIVLATLAQRVTFELVGRQRIVPEPLITLRPRYGIRMNVGREPSYSRSDNVLD